MDGGGRSRRRIQASEDPGKRKDYPGGSASIASWQRDRIHDPTATSWLRNNTQQIKKVVFACSRADSLRRLAKGKRHNGFIGCERGDFSHSW